MNRSTSPAIPAAGAATAAVIAPSSGITGLLTVAFVVLKLTGVIAWPWLWVLSPIWIPILISVVLAVIFLGIVGIAAARTKPDYVQYRGRRW